MVVTVSIIEDHAPTRESLAVLLQGTPGFNCASVHASAEAALKDWPPSKVRVALVDIQLPGQSGIELVPLLKARQPDLLVLMLTALKSTDLIFEALLAGADGYLLKRTPPAEVLEAIQEVVAGGAPMTRGVARKVLQHFHRPPAPAPVPVAPTTTTAPDVDPLTPREIEILEQLAIGYTDKELAAALGITSDTVRSHLRNIYKKLRVTTRTAAARFAQRPASR